MHGLHVFLRVRHLKLVQMAVPGIRTSKSKDGNCSRNLKKWNVCGTTLKNAMEVAGGEIVGFTRIAQGKAQWWALRTNHPSNSMEHSPSKSIVPRLLKIFPTFFRNQKFHSLAHSSPPLGPFLSYINRVHSLPPSFFTIHFNIPSTTVSSKWSLSFRFHYQNLVCPSPHTCHMPRQSHLQMGDFKSPAIMLSAWLIALLLGKVWASHSVAGDSGLLVCDFQRIRKYIPNNTGSTFHKTSLVALLLQEIADASLNV